MSYRQLPRIILLLVVISACGGGGESGPIPDSGPCVADPVAPKRVAFLP